MQFNMRKLAPAVAVLTLALAGCQTSPKQAANTDEGAAQAQTQTATAPAVEFYVARAAAAPGLMEIKVPDGALFLERQPALTRADLSEAAALVDRDGQNYVGLRFTEGGARKLNDVSNQNVGNMLALVIDRELVAAPRITETLNRGVLAFGVPSAQAASDIAAKIRGDQATAAQPSGGAAPAVPNPASPTAPAPVAPR